MRIMFVNLRNLVIEIDNLFSKITHGNREIVFFSNFTMHEVILQLKL